MTGQQCQATKWGTDQRSTWDPRFEIMDLRKCLKALMGILGGLAVGLPPGLVPLGLPPLELLPLEKPDDETSAASSWELFFPIATLRPPKFSAKALNECTQALTM